MEGGAGVLEYPPPLLMNLGRLVLLSEVMHISLARLFGTGGRR